MKDYVAERKKGPEPMINAYKVLVVHEPDAEMANLAKVLNDNFTFLNC